jgi:hypothetical protein
MPLLQAAATLRAKAKRLLSLANEIETEARGTFARADRVENGNEFELPTLGGVDAIKLRKRVERRKARVPVLAKEFNTTTDAILEIINNPENKLTIASRGWVTPILNQGE